MKYLCSKQLHKKIKALKHIFLALFALWCLGYAIPAGLLRLPGVQRTVKGRLESFLSERLQTGVSIGGVDWDWPNYITLDSVRLNDRSGVGALEAKHLAAGIRLLPLLHKRIVLNTVRLFDFSVRLDRPTASAPLNIQFLIDALAGHDTTHKASDVDLSIRSILLNGGDFHYDENDAAYTPGLFNPKHVEVYGLSAHILLDALKPDT
ncbi:MAG: translocation/assembly module TamB, partial [Tannerella sp.]|nr:translocation/assembly module TamB [Tannerella sp.]